MIKVAAEIIEIMPRAGSQGRTLLGNTASRVFTALKSSVIILEDDGRMVVLLTSHFMTHYYRISNLLRQVVAEALGIPRESVLCFSSHNHCVVKLVKEQYAFGQDDAKLLLSKDDLTAEGQELLQGCRDSACRLRNELKEATIRFGRGEEWRITHNRKGRRADGSTYLMREEDRLRLGIDYTGDIDADAFVVGFFDRLNQPIAMLTQFTGHPVSAFHCDFPVVHGEFPQIAGDCLSQAFGGIPVAFLQGCAGDTNSKGLLSAKPVEENVADAERYGRLLGDTFIAIARSLQSSTRADINLRWQSVYLPYRGVPAREELERRLEKAKTFLTACANGEVETTRGCDGLNFPTNMSVPYRAALIRPIHDWLVWALAFHQENRLHEAPAGRTLEIAVLRLGDVAIVGMPCEPLLGIGRQIKKSSPIACTIPCGYMNDTNIAYVPDGPNCDDLDYVSAFYRYTKSMLPFRQPAGDLLASAATQMIVASTAP